MTENLVITNPTVQYQTTADNTSLCNPIYAYWAVGMALIPLLQIVINGFVAIATFRSRSKLRHNYVYLYVINVLIGNMMFSFLSFYNIVNYGFVFERMWSSPLPFEVDFSKPQQQALQRWWAHRRAFSIAMYLITNANVSALIYGISGSSYLVGRYSKNLVSKGESIARRRYKACAIICFIWFIPTLLSLLEAFLAPCLRNCRCVYADYGEEFSYCQTDLEENSMCSRIWPPLTHRYLLVVALTWCVQIVFIVFMLVNAVRKWMRVMKPRNSVDSSRVDCDVTNISSTSTREVSESRCEVNCVNAPDLLRSDEELKPKKKISIRCGISIGTLHFLFVISSFFFITTLPSIVVVLIDVTSEDYILSKNSVPAVIAISLLYGLFLPAMMVYYMPRLRDAVENYFLSFKCCTKTTVHTIAHRKSPRAK